MKTIDKYGLLGEKLAHSLSPIIHELIFKYTSLLGTYELLPTAPYNISNVVNMVREGHLKGLNVTIPYKCDVIDMLDYISPSAENIGAVNTIVYKNDRLEGHNSDYFGFIQALKVQNIPIKDKNIAVLGGGGSSKSVICALNDLGAKSITIFSRNPDNVTINNVNNIWGYDKLQDDKFDILINTTPVGMFPNMDKSPIEPKHLDNLEGVIDLIYNPPNTKLLQYAIKKDIKCANGLYMLVAQAVLSQEIWNDVKLSYDIIDVIYDELIQGGHIG